MGIFPEDYEIHSSMLVRMWVAEGFLKPVNGKSLEELAKDYLLDLIGRNLVLVDWMNSLGSIKRCKIHDLLRDLCLREARKERFYACTREGIVNGQRRIFVSKKEHIDTLPSTSLLRSLVVQPVGDEIPSPGFNLRLLRILVSFGDPNKEFLENVHKFVNLRFFSFSVAMDTEFILPTSAYKLFWNLQTLTTIYCKYTKFSAPTQIWYMPHIRHLRFNMLILPDPPNDGIVLKNLQSLRRLKNFEFSKQVVKRIPNIKKLEIAYDDKLVDDRYCLNNLDCLHKLESLIFELCKDCNLSGVAINFPHSLKKLDIVAVDSQDWQDILNKIGVLPLLQKLTLVGGSFSEGKWETTEAHFPSLKLLKIYECDDLQVWITESSHFPCLQFLQLMFLEKFEEIPFNCAEMSTLEEIYVFYCNNSVVVSAKRILEEREELYGEEEAFQVRVYTEDDALKSLECPKFIIK